MKQSNYGLRNTLHTDYNLFSISMLHFTYILTQLDTEEKEGVCVQR